VEVEAEGLPLSLVRAAEAETRVRQQRGSPLRGGDDELAGRCVPRRPVAPCLVGASATPVRPDRSGQLLAALLLGGGARARGGARRPAAPAGAGRHRRRRRRRGRPRDRTGRPGTVTCSRQLTSVDRDGAPPLPA
jgi:hypothetical protein